MPIPIEQFNYECEKRFEWWLAGICTHGISAESFAKMSTERIVQLYNVEMIFFRPNL